MKSFALTAVLAASVAAMVLALTGSSPAQNGPQSFPKIGIVNLKDCFDDKKNDQVKDLQKDINEMKDRYTNELNELKKQMQTTQSKMADAPKDGPLFRKFRKELADLQGSAKVKEELGKLELQEYWRKARGEVYDNVCKAAETVAKAKGLDLIIKDDSPAGETEDDRSQVPSDMKIVYRALLYYDAKYDITKETLVEVNKIWAVEKAKNPNPK